ncbi:MAG: sigma-70 region 4 domain-containing protein [Clostridia bacterium]|nr:sigma-70 region 4 domain-containing protein [Clostridia bacterium]
MFHKLEEAYREVFTLRTFCDLTHAEIAALLRRVSHGQG